MNMRPPLHLGDSRFMSVDAIEDLHYKKLYGIGDVKTKTTRYPIKKIQELCGPLPGDWCVMSTQLDDGFKVWAIGHRRGGEVHTFVASCGTTVAGVPQKHREDMGVYGNMEPRKCPKVLNLWTKQQPKIDRNNRFRQDILAIEERFVTRSFPFRMLTSLVGMTFANSFDWFNYFTDNKQYEGGMSPEDGFIKFMRSLSYDGMHNTYDQEELGPRSPSATPAAAAPSPVRTNSPRQIACAHRAVPIKSVPGYVGSPKQLCAVCQDNNHKTRHCCFLCSTPERIFGIHPRSISYGKCTITYDCLDEHHRDPTNKIHQANRAAPTGRKRGGGRKRRRDEDSEESE